MRRGLVIASALALFACSGAGGSSIHVTREGRPGQDFASVHLECTVSRPDPVAETRVLACTHGDPETNGLELVAYAAVPLDTLAEGATLQQGVDLQVTTIAGRGDGTLWGSAGDSSWWMGDLSIVFGERADGGQSATFEGTMQTTETASLSGLAPITVEFDAVAATLP